MKYAFTLTALAALDQYLTTRAQSSGGQHKFIFNHSMCKDHDKDNS
jgi:hypothetical protein